jgi:hypothetical protein
MIRQFGGVEVIIDTLPSEGLVREPSDGFGHGLFASPEQVRGGSHPTYHVSGVGVEHDRPYFVRL